MSPLRRSFTPITAHWSKDYVEHLRSTHFGLVVISLGLIIMVMTAKPYDAHAALDQIDEIVGLQHAWNTNWVAEHAKKTSLEFRKGTPLSHCSVTLVNGIAYYMQLDWTTVGHVFGPYNQNGDLVAWDSQRFPSTLGQFARWQANVNDQVTFYDVSAIDSNGEAAIVDDNRNFSGKFQCGEIQILNRKAKISGYALQLERAEVKFSPEGKKKLIVYGNSGEGGGTYFTLIYHPLEMSEFDLSHEEILGFHHSGSFQEAYPELAAATRNQLALPLDIVAHNLEEEVSKGANTFEAFGLKFPASQITLWGIVILLSIQTYFFIYLKQLTGKLSLDDPGWDVPWIGMDGSLLARTLFFFSIACAPIIAVLLIFGHSLAHILTKSLNGTWNISLWTWSPTWTFSTITQIVLLSCATILVAFLSFKIWTWHPVIVKSSTSG